MEYLYTIKINCFYLYKFITTYVIHVYKYIIYVFCLKSKQITLNYFVAYIINNDETIIKCK